jgi:hypothetical protein
MTARLPQHSQYWKSNCEFSSVIAMPSPTLLSLPREIRNIVYSHLHQDLSLDWGFRMYPFPLGGHCAVRIEMRNAPIPEVFRTCAQIYHEYNQGRYLRKPGITISGDSTFHMLESEPTNQARVFKVLGGIQQLNFVLDTKDGESAKERWASVDELSEAIAVLSPKLDTICVIATPLPNTELDWSLPQTNTPESNSAPSPPVLAGRLLTYGKAAFWNESVQISDYLVAGCKQIERCNAALAGKWLFTRGMNNERLISDRQASGSV